MPAVVAVIATYQPPDLTDLVEAVRPQVSFIVIADDASPATADRTLAAITPLVDAVHRFDRNAGIGRSLNVGLRLAQSQGAEWLLALDQDSRPDDTHVADLLATAATASDLRVGAVGVGQVVGSAGVLAIPAKTQGDSRVAEELVQAGTLWNVTALTSVGGFDETLGMDGVDAAAGIRLQRAGWTLLVARDVALRHEIGDSRPVSLLGRTVQATSHSPARRESILRNRLRLAPEAAGVSMGYAVRTVRRAAMGAVLASTVEDDRWAKTKASLRGLLPRRGQ